MNLRGVSRLIQLALIWGWLRRVQILASTGSLPVVAGSLPTTIVFGKLPNTACWQPALPGKDGR
jgi:hypothetical protein